MTFSYLEHLLHVSYTEVQREVIDLDKYLAEQLALRTPYCCFVRGKEEGSTQGKGGNQPHQPCIGCFWSSVVLIFPCPSQPHRSGSCIQDAGSHAVRNVGCICIAPAIVLPLQSDLAQSMSKIELKPKALPALKCSAFGTNEPGGQAATCIVSSPCLTCSSPVRSYV